MPDTVQELVNGRQHGCFCRRLRRRNPIEQQRGRAQNRKRRTQHPSFSLGTTRSIKHRNSHVRTLAPGAPGHSTAAMVSRERGMSAACRRKSGLRSRDRYRSCGSCAMAMGCTIPASPLQNASKPLSNKPANPYHRGGSPSRSPRMLLQACLASLLLIFPVCSLRAQTPTRQQNLSQHIRADMNFLPLMKCMAVAARPATNTSPRFTARRSSRGWVCNPAATTARSCSKRQWISPTQAEGCKPFCQHWKTPRAPSHGTLSRCFPEATPASRDRPSCSPRTSTTWAARKRPVHGDSIYNGADDDASGTTAVLNLARVLASSKTHKRTLSSHCSAAKSWAASAITAS